jgi:uncharacterized damage-inducible protein DinB
MRNAESQVPEFDHEMSATRQVLERVPDAKWTWKPHAKSSSLGDLATHIASLPSWIAVSMESDVFDVTPKSGPAWQPAKCATTREVLALLDANVAQARAALESCPDAHFEKPWSLMAGERKIISMPRSRVARSFVMSHLFHHRGQLTVYLRLLDVPLPRVYGPTADVAH